MIVELERVLDKMNGSMASASGVPDTGPDTGPDGTPDAGPVVFTSLDLEMFSQPDYFIIVLYVLVMVTSLCANTLLLIIVIKFQYIKSVTNIFLLNLSAADLLVTLFCMPVQIAKAVTLLWHYGEFLCKTINVLQGVAVSSSIFTLAAMSVDRYLAITRSLRQPWMPSRRCACALLAVLWLIAASIFTPLIYVATTEVVFFPVITYTDNNSTVVDHGLIFCTEKWPASMKKELFGTFSFIIVYALPGSIVMVSYLLMGRRLCSVLPPFDDTEGGAGNQQHLRLVRERKRVAIILLLLAVLFALCWMPYNILMLLIDLEAVNVENVALMLPYTLLLGHTNSAINPIVYCLMMRNFRRSLRQLLCYSSGNHSSTTHIHMQSRHQKGTASSCRTLSSLTQRSSRIQRGRASVPPSPHASARNNGRNPREP